MRFIHLADVHIGKTYRGKDFFDWNLFEKSIKKILDLSPDFVLISGDLFDSPQVKPDDLLKTIELLKKLKKKNIPVFTIEGNHDYNNKGLTYYDLLSKLGLINNLSSGDKIGYLKEKYESEFVNFKEIELVGNKMYMAYGEFEGKIIKGLAYIRSEKTLKILIPKFLDKGDVALLHQSVSKISGIPEENCEVKLEELTSLDFNYFALGHIHSSNFPNISFNHKKVVYSGSLDFTSKKDFHKIIWIGELKDQHQKKGFILFDNNNVEFIDSDVKNYYDVLISFNDLKELREKLDYINSKYSIDKLILNLETDVKLDRSSIIKLVNEFFEDKILEIKVNMPEKDNLEVKVEFEENNEYEELVNKFINLKENYKNKEMIKEHIKTLVLGDYNLNEVKKELKKIKKDSGIFKFLK